MNIIGLSSGFNGDFLKQRGQKESVFYPSCLCQIELIASLLNRELTKILKKHIGD